MGRGLPNGAKRLGVRQRSLAVSRGARLCPQDQSQRVNGGEAWEWFSGGKVFVRAAADPALRDTAALQPQRGCSIQPSVGDPSRTGEERLRWVTEE